MLTELLKTTHNKHHRKQIEYDIQSYKAIKHLMELNRIWGYGIYFLLKSEQAVAGSNPALSTIHILNSIYSGKVAQLAELLY